MSLFFKNKLTTLLKIDFFLKKRFYSQFIKKGDLCFDIGANKGVKSRLFLSLGAKVIAFEPQQSCKKHLTQIKNPNFKYLSVGVGSKDEKKDLYLANHLEVATFSNQFINYFSNEKLQWEKSESVTVKKLDTLIKEYGVPHYCKIDVEGYEQEILSNLSYKIPYLEFEFTAGFISETLEIIKKLDTENTRFNFLFNERPKLQLKHWVNGDKMIALFKELPKRDLHGNILVKNNNAH